MGTFLEIAILQLLSWSNLAVVCNKATVAVRRASAAFKFTVSFFAETNTGNTLMPNLIRQNGEENVHGKSIANFKYLHLEIHKYLHFLPSCQTAFNLKFCKAIKKQIKKLRLQ